MEWIRQGVMRVCDIVTDLVYPRVCANVACGRSSDRPQRYLCSDCINDIMLFATDGYCDLCGNAIEGKVHHTFVCEECRMHVPWFDKARSAVVHQGLLRNMIVRFKYNHAVWLQEDLVDFLEACARTHFNVDAVDVVVPVPLHVTRLRDRTYNQAELLASSLATRIDRRLDCRSLARVQYTEKQTLQGSARDRWKNMRDVFAVVDPAGIRYRTVLLVDDVMTTGATLSACAKVLKHAGARRVWAVTVARGKQ